MSPKRAFQQKPIRRQIVVTDVLERVWRQSRTPDVERGERIGSVIVMLAESGGKRYASFTRSERREQAHPERVHFVKRRLVDVGPEAFRILEPHSVVPERLAKWLVLSFALTCRQRLF